jgi:hypothetical protein
MREGISRLAFSIFMAGSQSSQPTIRWLMKRELLLGRPKQRPYEMRLS